MKYVTREILDALVSRDVPGELHLEVECVTDLVLADPFDTFPHGLLDIILTDVNYQGVKIVANPWIPEGQLHVLRDNLLVEKFYF